MALNMALLNCKLAGLFNIAGDDGRLVVNELAVCEIDVDVAAEAGIDHDEDIVQNRVRAKRRMFHSKYDLPLRDGDFPSSLFRFCYTFGRRSHARESRQGYLCSRPRRHPIFFLILPAGSYLVDASER